MVAVDHIRMTSTELIAKKQKAGKNPRPSLNQFILKSLSRVQFNQKF
jgi:hypothetical protein